MYAKSIVALIAVLCVAGAAAICGYRVHDACPGCTPSNPSGGCHCGVNSGSCDCKKTSGGIQTGVKTECYTDWWTYISDSNGYVINQGADEVCSKNFMCMKEDGSQTNCGTLSGSTCLTQPPQPACAWRLFGNANSQPTWLEGSQCQPG